jgi:hypothetical protein
MAGKNRLLLDASQVIPFQYADPLYPQEMLSEPDQGVRTTAWVYPFRKVLNPATSAFSLMRKGRAELENAGQRTNRVRSFVCPHAVSASASRL